MSSAPARGSPFASLDPCVHCGFCLPACPTYLATGDEADSPRGRIVLMRALERGELAADDPGLVQHLDACLGCRGCEPVCPSGVGYGRGLESARRILADRNGFAPTTRALLSIFRHATLWRPLFATAKLLRATRLPALLAGRGRLGFAMGMVAATSAEKAEKTERMEKASKAERMRTFAGPAERGSVSADPSPPGPPSPSSRLPSVALFRGCVMDALFDHVHAATKRTLQANGYRVVEVTGQVCCGALHDHAGDVRAARELAARNVAAFAGRADYIVVNSAGCGALLKDYGHLLGEDLAEAVAGRVRDVSELLAAAGPRSGAPLEIDVAYDAPCHLQHAQRVHTEPLTVLRSIPGLRLRLIDGFDRCCGSAGIYSMTRPGMARAVLADKIAAIAAADPRPQLIATGNPGCLMQIGGGLRAAGLDIGVVHPVELLDRSYQTGGVYAATGEK